MNPDQPNLSIQPHIILITGNMAAGKSSVAQALAQRLPRSVHLRGDLFRRMIVNGQADMSFDLPEEAQQQLYLRYRIAAAVVPLYLQAGFTMIYQDIIVGPALTEVVSYYAAYPLSVFVLCPRPEAIAAREAARAKSGYATMPSYWNLTASCARRRHDLAAGSIHRHSTLQKRWICCCSIFRRQPSRSIDTDESAHVQAACWECVYAYAASELHWTQSAICNRTRR